MMRSPRLVYVEEQWAYFTTQPVNEAWGDDWNDAPYQFNAGPPYEYSERDVERGREPWVISKVAFDGPFWTPDDSPDRIDTAWSVEDINRLKIPWLRTNDGIEILPGATLDEFKRSVALGGGATYERG